MASITDDNRADVRNGILHTIFRIVENCGAELSSSVWQLYIEKVVFRIININVENLVKYGSPNHNSNSDIAKSLISSSEVILKGLAKLIGTNIDRLVQISMFEDVWQDILEHFASYLDLGLRDLYTLTFQAIAQLVSSAEINKKLKSRSVDGNCFSVGMQCTGVFGSGEGRSCQHRECTCCLRGLDNWHISIQ